MHYILSGFLDTAEYFSFPATRTRMPWIKITRSAMITAGKLHGTEILSKEEVLPWCYLPENNKVTFSSPNMPEEPERDDGTA